MFEKLDNMINEMKPQVNILYGNLKIINDKLLKKANNSYEDAEFLDVVDFAITSYGMSFVKNVMYNVDKSLTNALLMRNIIEYLALREMYNKGKITNTNVKLMRYEGYIDDYFLYKDNLKDIPDKEIIDMEVLKKRLYNG